MKSTTKAALASAISILAVCASQPAAAEETAAAGDASDTQTGDEGNDSEIVVLAERLRGQVDSAQPPILVLDEEDIAAYGAGSIAELVEQLAPETSSGRGRGTGRPVFLVNGMRVSSFREMRSYPPEAIRRVEVLPEETALKYGFSADQRIINFILKDNFSSKELELDYGQPDRGGSSSKEAEATYLRIDGPSRLNLNLDWEDTSLLTEAERGVVQAPGSVPDVLSDPDPAAYRSLLPDSSDLEATANWTTKLGENGSSLSLNGTVERADSRSLSGLDRVLLTDPEGDTALRSFGANDPLERRTRTTTYSLGSALNAPLGDWQLTGTLDAAHGTSRTEIDRYADTSALVAAAAAGTLPIDGNLPAIADPGFDEARSDTDTLDSLVTLIGSPFYSPAGDVSVTVDGGFKWNRIQSEDTRNPGLETDLSRSRFSGGVNLGVPIASRRDDAWAWLGDFDLNFSAGIDQLSDFGTLTDWTAGFVWGVTDELSLQASYITSERAPSLTELGSPEVVSLNVPVYDFSRGETVLVSTTSGGNPDLAKERQRDIRLAAMWDLPFLERSNLSIEYFRNGSSDVSASFPLLTPAIEAAFPGRVTRDASGQLTAIDQRPVTIAQQNSSRLKFGLNLSGGLGGSSQDRGSRQDSARAAPPAEVASGACSRCEGLAALGSPRCGSACVAAKARRRRTSPSFPSACRSACAEPTARWTRNAMRRCAAACAARKGRRLVRHSIPSALRQSARRCAPKVRSPISRSCPRKCSPGYAALTARSTRSAWRGLRSGSAARRRKLSPGSVRGNPRLPARMAEHPIARRRPRPIGAAAVPAASWAAGGGAMVAGRSTSITRWSWRTRQ